MKAERKSKGRTLKQWAARSGRPLKPKYVNDIHLHRFENEVILRKMAECGGKAAPRDLYRENPDVFSRHLPRAMKRMAKDGLIVQERFGGGFFGGPTYRPPVVGKKGAKRAVA